VSGGSETANGKETFSTPSRNDPICGRFSPSGRLLDALGHIIPQFHRVTVTGTICWLSKATKDRLLAGEDSQPATLCGVALLIDTVFSLNHSHQVTLGFLSCRTMSEEQRSEPVEEPVKGEETTSAEGGIATMERELEDIMENEAYDSDDVARGRSPGRPPSRAGSVSSSGSGSKGKRRTWKKPKDKPKRPLSAYNIFFKHERQRIVEGRPEECSAQETLRAIEAILSTSRDTRRHRKTHGRISFGDLARKIAEKWKSINPDQKAVFEHYAELDMRRYRKEVKLWTDRKESEAYAKQSGMDGSANASFSSTDTDADFMFDHLGGLSNHSDDAQWTSPRNFYVSMNSSFSSAASASESQYGLEPIPIGDMLRNARPNMHSSMPNLNYDARIPEGPGSMMFNPMNGMNFGHASTNFGQGTTDFGNSSMAMLGYEMDDRSPPMVISSGNPGACQLEQLRQQNEFQQQELQRQQELLIRQQELLQQQLRQANMMNMNMSNSAGNLNLSQGGVSGMSIPSLVGNNTVFSMSHNHDTFANDGEGGNLENYLCNLDLSHVRQG